MTIFFAALIAGRSHVQVSSDEAAQIKKGTDRAEVPFPSSFKVSTTFVTPKISPKTFNFIFMKP